MRYLFRKNKESVLVGQGSGTGMIVTDRSTKFIARLSLASVVFMAMMLFTMGSNNPLNPCGNPVYAASTICNVASNHTFDAGVTVNDDGGLAVTDHFRVETDNNANAIDTDAANDRVAIGQDASTNTSPFEVAVVAAFGDTVDITGSLGYTLSNGAVVHTGTFDHAGVITQSSGTAQFGNTNIDLLDVQAPSGNGQIFIDVDTPGQNSNLTYQESGANQWAWYHNASDGDLELYDYSNSTVRVNVRDSDFIAIPVDDVIIGADTNPDGKFHIFHSDASQTADASANELTVECSAGCGMSILSGASSDGIIAFGDSGADNIGQIRYRHISDQLQFLVNGQIPLVLQATGTGSSYFSDGQGLVVGHEAQINPGILYKTQILGTGATDGGMLLGNFSVDNNGASFNFLKSGSATITLGTIVADNDEAFDITSRVDDGSGTSTRLLTIQGYVDDAFPAAGAIGGRLVISTATTAGAMTEALRIDSSQNFDFNNGDLNNLGDAGTDITGSAATIGVPLIVSDNVIIDDDRIFNIGNTFMWSDRGATITNSGGTEQVNISQDDGGQVAIEVTVNGYFGGTGNNNFIAVYWCHATINISSIGTNSCVVATETGASAADLDISMTHDGSGYDWNIIVTNNDATENVVNTNVSLKIISTGGGGSEPTIDSISY